MFSQEIRNFYNKEWVSRPYRPGDEKGIALLFKKTFPYDFKDYDEYWQWEFTRNPAGTRSIQVAEHRDGEIIGHYAITHRDVCLNSSVMNIALSLDTMTHPDFQKKGIFTALANDLYERLAKNKIHLTYGFPNANSVFGFKKKLDWHIFGFTPVMIRPINLKRLGALLGDAKKAFWLKFLNPIFSPKCLAPFNGCIRGCRWNEIGVFDSEADLLWQRMRREYGIAIDRNSEYLNWRYIEKPGANYFRLELRSKADRLLGIMILKIEDYHETKLGLVADLIALPGQMLRTAMISHAVSILAKLGADAVISICVPETALFRPFQMNLFFLIPRGLNPIKNYWGVRRNTRYLSSNTVLDPNQWLISCGDTDLV